MWEQVAVGHSGDPVFRGRGVYRKHSAEAELEAAKLSWLREQGLPAAEVVDVDDDWLVTREVAGRTGADWWPEHQRTKVVDVIAEITSTLHAVPVSHCPFDRSVSVTAAHARRVFAAGRIDPNDLDDEWQDWPPEQLIAVLERQLPAMAGRQVLTVTHGDWCLPNIVLNPESLTVVGILDAARAGVADGYADLALMHRSLRSASLNPQYGDQLADRFLARCGHKDHDNDKLDFYRLLDELF